MADAVVSKVGNLDLAPQRTVDPNRFETPLNIHLEYTYSVRGEQWKNEYVARWRSAGRREFREAAEFLENNPVGKRFQILHHPENPFDSLLNGPRNPLVGMLTATFGAALTVFALINWFFTLALVVQLAAGMLGIGACALIVAVADYPFERPWWFEKSEDEAESFMLNTNLAKQPDRFQV